MTHGLRTLARYHYGATRPDHTSGEGEEVRHRKARTARNPRTGKPVEVSARGVRSSNPRDTSADGWTEGSSVVAGRPGEEVGKA